LTEQNISSALELFPLPLRLTDHLGDLPNSIPRKPLRNRSSPLGGTGVATEEDWRAASSPRCSRYSAAKTAYLILYQGVSWIENH
jgi:hypothetical protein